MAIEDRESLVENGRTGLSKTKKIVISSLASALVVAAVIGLILTVANPTGKQYSLAKIG